MCSRKKPNPKKQLADALKASKPKKQSKYKNKKTVVNGITFDSQREAMRWSLLLALQNAGRISGLQRQVRYPYVLYAAKPTSCTTQYMLRIGKQRCYIADFVYYNGAGLRVVEDSKGFRTKEYRAKKKIVEALYGIKIIEV
jgi:hypothetical protein